RLRERLRLPRRQRRLLLRPVERLWLRLWRALQLDRLRLSRRLVRQRRLRLWLPLRVLPGLRVLRLPLPSVLLPVLLPAASPAPAAPSRRQAPARGWPGDGRAAPGDPA